MRTVFVVLGLLALATTLIGVTRRLGKPLTPIGIGVWGFGAIFYFATTVKIEAGNILWGSPFDSTLGKAMALMMLIGMVLTVVGLALPVNPSSQRKRG